MKSTIPRPISGVRPRRCRAVVITWPQWRSTAKSTSSADGSAQTRDSTGLHDIYDPATQIWTSGPLMPTPRGGGSGAFYHGMVVYLGGEDDKRAYNENEGFDVKTNRWVTLAPMPTPHHGIGVTAIGNMLYVAGGGRSRGNRQVTNDLLAFTIP